MKTLSRNVNEKVLLVPLFADGNGAANFTQSGTTARKFEKTVEVGQIAGLAVTLIYHLSLVTVKS